jgi:hypothetical protein
LLLLSILIRCQTILVPLVSHFSKWLLI